MQTQKLAILIQTQSSSQINSAKRKKSPQTIRATSKNENRSKSPGMKRKKEQSSNNILALSSNNGTMKKRKVSTFNPVPRESAEVRRWRSANIRVGDKYSIWYEDYKRSYKGRVDKVSYTEADGPACLCGQCSINFDGEVPPGVNIIW